MTQEKNVKDLTFKDLAKMAREEAEAFATHIIGEAPTYRTGREVRYYENQSLVVFISGPKQGRYKSFADDQARGDLFDLWRYVRGGTPHDAVMGYKNYAGLDTAKGTETVKMNRGPSPEEVRRQEEKDIADRMRKAQWIWKNASPTEGREEGLTYLRNRGITIEPDSDTVRFRKLTQNDLGKMGVKPADMPADPVVSVIFKATNDLGCSAGAHRRRPQGEVRQPQAHQWQLDWKLGQTRRSDFVGQTADGRGPRDRSVSV
jgi:hypothetical protein